MKKSVIITAISVLFLFTGASLLTSCGNSSEQTEHHEHKDNKKEDVYACPMHHDITGKKGDKCSKCGMELTNTTTAPEHQGHSH